MIVKDDITGVPEQQEVIVCPLAIFGKLSLRMSHVLHRWLVTVFGVHGMFEGDIFLLTYEGNMVNIDMICWIFAPLVGQKKRLPQQ